MQQNDIPYEMGYSVHIASEQNPQTILCHFLNIDDFLTFKHSFNSKMWQPLKYFPIFPNNKQ